MESDAVKSLELDGLEVIEALRYVAWLSNVFVQPYALALARPIIDVNGDGTVITDAQ